MEGVGKSRAGASTTTRRSRRDGFEDGAFSIPKTAHMLLIMYERHLTALMPSQLYHDIQDIIKDLYAVVAKAQIEVESAENGAFEAEPPQ